jgi:hypothetical protein
VPAAAVTTVEPAEPRTVAMTAARIRSAVVVAAADRFDDLGL